MYNISMNIVEYLQGMFPFLSHFIIYLLKAVVTSYTTFPFNSG